MRTATQKRGARQYTGVWRVLLALVLCGGIAAPQGAFLTTLARADEPDEVVEVAEELEAAPEEEVTPTEEAAPAEEPAAEAAEAPATPEEEAVPSTEPVLTAQADDFDGRIWFESERDDVFSDGTLDLWLRQEGTIEDPYVIHLVAGCWEGQPDFEHPLNEGEAYTYDAATGKITIDGAWLHANGYDHLLLIASVAYEPAGASDDWHFVEGADDDRWINVREAREEYDRAWDRDVLPGWTIDVRQYYHFFVENSEHPEGLDGDYEVTNVEIVDERSNEDDAPVFSLEDTNGGWHYRAEAKGEATFRVTYLDIDGHEKSYEFTGRVTGRTMGLDVWAEGSAICIPGQQIELRAQAIDYREGEEDDYEGFSYTWEIADQDTGIIPMPPAVQYPDENRVIITTNDLQNGSYNDGYDERHFRVVVKAYKDGYETERDFWITVATQYPEIWFKELDDVNLPTYLLLGETISVTPEIHYFDVTQDNNYPAGSSRGTVASYTWYFDENCLSITDWQGNEVHDGNEVAAENGLTPNAFTIKRTGDWDTDIALDVSWYPNDGQGIEFADESGLRRESNNWHFDSVDLDMWFDGDLPDTLLVRDGFDTLTLPLNTRNIGDSMDLEWTVGLWDDIQWTDRFAEGTDYSLNGNEVTLNGRAILSHLREGDDHQLNVRVAVEAKTGDEVICQCDRWVRFLEPFEEYDREWNRDVLPGWDGTIAGDYSVFVCDEAHPDGEDFRYQVVNVDVISGEELLSDFHPDSEGDDHWWYYRAGSPGTVTFKVTYQKLDGTEDSYTFDLNIGDRVYNLSISAKPEVDNVLPGGRVDVWAKGTKQTAVKHDHDDYYDYEETSEGLDYVWELEEGGDIAQMSVDPTDPGHIILTINDVPAGEDSLEGFVLARVKLFDGGDMVKRSGWAFDVHSDFIEPYIEGFDPSLPLGQSQDILVDLRHYVYGQSNYTPVDDAQFYFWYDPNCVSITDSAGHELAEDTPYPAGIYTLTRKGDWDTDINMQAVWFEDGDQREYHTSRRLERLDYDLWFDDSKHDIDLWVTRNDDDSLSDFADATNTVSLSDSLAEIDGLAIDWTVGTWENDQWDQVFGPESGLYTVSADGKSITSNVSAMAEQDVRNLRVTASVKLGNVKIETHNDFWFHLRERQIQIDREWDRDMLPGDEGTVYRWYYYRLEDEEQPEGNEGDYEVTDVTTSNAAIVSVRREDWGEGDKADHNWRYTTEAMGTATLTVSYELPDGTQDSYTFDVHVTGDVYSVDIWSEDGADSVLPGSVVELHAQGTHRREGQPDTDEGLTYQWEIIRGQEICHELVVDPNDPQHATVTIKTPAEAGKMGFDDDVAVSVKLFDGTTDEVAQNGWWFRVASTFQEAYPATINRELRVGQSEQLNLEVRDYQYGQDGFTTVEGAEFAFHFDGDCVSITDAQGREVTNSDEVGDEVFYPAGTYTITRTGQWNTVVNVSARWTDKWGNQRYYHRAWWLDWIDYYLPFGAEQYRTNENCAAAIKLDVSGVSGIPNYANYLNIGVGSNWNEETGSFANDLDPSEYTIAQANDVWTITIPGSVVAAWSHGKLDVFASFIMREGDIVKVWGGGETSVIATTDDTHVLSHVDAIDPHDGENGVAEHWRCDSCGATFADAAGTQPMSAEDLVVEPTEQAITAANKSVAMGKTVAIGAKAQGKLSYKSSNTKVATVNAAGVVTPVGVGKATITISAAASGVYKAASKDVTVTVGKGANPMTVKAKAKSFPASKTKKTTLKKAKTFTITGAQGKITFKKLSGDKLITVSKSGKIVVKKGLKKKTYKVKIQVTAAGNANWNAVSKTVTIKLKMK